MDSDKNVILVIDDNVNNIRLIVDYLKASGFETAMARDGLSGLKRARLLTPDLILLDVKMPDMDGFETCRKLKSDPSTADIPIIFMTALDNIDDKVRAFSCGGVDYITKPTQREEILMRVKTHLNLRSIRESLKKQKELLENEVEVRKRNENMLKQYKTVVSATQDLISLLDRNYTYVMVNEAYLTAHNKTSDEVQGHTVADLLGETVFETLIKEKLDRCWKGEIINFQFWFDFAGFGKRCVSVNYAPVWDESGRAISFIVSSARDITEQKRAEEEVQKAREAAETANRTKSSFLANMSHEIRTPMNSIINFARILKDTRLNEQQKEYTEIIIGSSNILLALINDILDFSKIEAGKLEISNTGFQIRHMIREIEDILSIRAKKKGLGFTVHIDEAVPDWLYGDPVRIGQIVLNFANNAVKFTHQGSVRIQVALDQLTGETAAISFMVTDTGIGMPRDKMHCLFTPFTQMDPSFTRKYGGSGLGLAISKQLAELMDGAIEVNSVEGEGSSFRFTISLALCDDMALKIENRAMDGVIPAAEKKNHLRQPSDVRILIAEDNDFNQKVAIALLNKFGLTADVAGNGKLAVEKLRSEDYDLVFMDIQMPEMDGVEATRAIRAADSGVRNRSVPVIAMTAHAMKGDREQFISSGMNDYISKPLDPEVLIRVIRNAVPFDIADIRPDYPAVENDAASADHSDCGEISFDKNELLRRLGGHLNDRRGLLETFAVSVFVELRQVKESLAQSNLNAAAIKAHSIKGIAGNVSAPKLRQMAIRLETALQSGDAGAASGLLPEIEAEARDVLAEIIGAGLGREELLTAYDDYISFDRLDSESISKIPSNLASRLKNAAEKLDMEILEDTIHELNAEFPEIGKVFSGLANNYNYVEIQNLLKKWKPT